MLGFTLHLLVSSALIAKVRFAKIRIIQLCLIENGFVEVYSAQVGVLEGCLRESWYNVWMLFPPLIPMLYALPEYVELVLLCHVVSSPTSFQ